MHKLVVVLALAAAFTAFAAPKRAAAPKAPPPPPVDEGPMVTIGGEGVFAIVNAAGAPEEPLATAAKKIGNIMMINAELRQGEFALAGAKDKMGGANAAVFVASDPALPLSLIAMEEKWGVVNAQGLAPKQLEKEVLRVATIVLGGAVSKYTASSMRPVYSVSDLDAAGELVTFDSLMAIFPNLKSLGITQFQTMSYRDACFEGLAPAPTDERERKIAAEVEAELAQERK